MANVLFICVRNAGTSQLAQALRERLGGSARSAGSHPVDELDGAVAEALEEIGIDISGRAPRAVAKGDLDWADLVVTMGGADAGLVPSGTEHLEWNLADPVGLCLEEARELRAVIEARVGALPV